jgi:hypothetical protein
MSLQLSVAVRNARLDAIETTVGTTAKLAFYSGAVPANCAASNPAGLLATLTLPSDWLANASAGSKALLGTWTGSASGAGNAASFRVFASDGTTCGAQGTVTATGGGGDLTLDNINIANAQTINITSFTLTDGNA